MINKCVCGCNPQQGKLNINSDLNKDFNKVIKSPNQSDLNKQLLLQQVNKKPGSISPEGTGSVSLPNDLVLSQLRELNSEVGANANSITNLQKSVSDLDSDITSINNKLNNFSSLKFQKVSSLPTSDISENIIYLLSIEQVGDKNSYDEYVYIDGKWELIGATEFDITSSLPHIGGSPGKNTNVWIDTDLSDDQEVIIQQTTSFSMRMDTEILLNDISTNEIMLDENEQHCDEILLNE